jgi:preprotein translocase subunit SecE
MATASTSNTTDKVDKPAKANKPSKATKPAKPNVFVRLMGYFRDVRSEMKRVVWPTRGEVINSSVVVVTTLIFFIIFISLTDLIVQRVVFFIQQIGG